MEIKIEKIVTGGYGLARTEEGVVLCRGVIPGETVEVSNLDKKAGVSWATLNRIIEPSPARVESTCPYYPNCGGCDFMHMNREAELHAKREIIKETLERVGKLDVEVADFDQSAYRDRGEQYRNSIRLQGGAGYVGYFSKATEDIVDIEDCLIAVNPIRTEIMTVRSEVGSGSIPMPKNIVIRAGNDTKKEDNLSTKKTVRGKKAIGGNAVYFTFSGKKYKVSQNSFFQVNIRVAETMLEYLKENLSDGPRILDLFAGVGTFAIALSDRFETVKGFEVSKDALADFRTNIKGIDNIEVIKWDAGLGLKGSVMKDDILILDPPRAGLPPKLRKDLAAIDVGGVQIAYISCDAATLARDLAELCKAGYKVVKPIKVFDMFPRTAHVETITFLERTEENASEEKSN